ncbi:YSIRK-type signal peptide-containing protein, partial [Staphylococcus aureus]|nr:YSIRK-type signal peptide-containing protein [Staphylococcus aureus]
MFIYYCKECFIMNKQQSKVRYSIRKVSIGTFLNVIM